MFDVNAAAAKLEAYCQSAKRYPPLTVLQTVSAAGGTPSLGNLAAEKGNCERLYTQVVGDEKLSEPERRELGNTLCTLVGELTRAIHQRTLEAGARLGALLLRQRQARGLTIGELAKQLPVGPEVYSRLERGGYCSSQIPQDVLQAIAAALDLNFQEVARATELDLEAPVEVFGIQAARAGGTLESLNGIRFVR